MLALSLSGCGTKLTKENYDKVKMGMTKAEVEAILGKPTEEGLASGGSQIVYWKFNQKSISIGFSNGKVVNKMAEL